MYHLSTSFLVLFFLFSCFHHLSSASSIGWCEAPFQCGDITAGFPFSGGYRTQVCGHPSLELNCYKNGTSIIISNHLYHVRHLDQRSKTLTLVSAELLAPFCQATFTDTTLPPDILELSPTFKSLNVFYLCNPNRPYRSSYTCPGRGVVTVSETLDYHSSCDGSFVIHVPKSFVLEEKKLNLTRLERAISEGFEVKVKIDEKVCQDCLSSHGTCGFGNTTEVCCKEPSSSECITLNPPSNAAGISHRAIAGATLFMFWFLGLVGMVVVVILVAGGFFCVIGRLRKTSDDQRKQKLKALIPLKHYSYAQVKRITKSFAQVVGKGGFGTVYRGTLSDGSPVAVKVLKDSKGDGEDFINEVASMSKTSHVNIVSLLGFCSEGCKRAIIYEFVENGSLDNFMSSNTSLTMDWMALYGIALGVARGLEYLHYGCKTRIVHFDIKPSNVLVDKNLCPKVSDFGLAKLCEKKESIMSLVDTRGTIGYIAPEMFSRLYGSVSHKSDVYSYGMLVLEMIGARNKPSTENSASNPSSMYFPEWIYRDLEKRDGCRPIENGISSEEEEISKKMTLVGLWCVQSSPSNRPPMNRVVEMMEGSLEALEVPPRPVLQQIPAMPLSESFWASEESSNTSDVLICSTN